MAIRFRPGRVPLPPPVTPGGYFLFSDTMLDDSPESSNSRVTSSTMTPLPSIERASRNVLTIGVREVVVDSRPSVTKTVPSQRDLVVRVDRPLTFTLSDP